MEMVVSAYYVLAFVVFFFLVFPMGEVLVSLSRRERLKGAVCRNFDYACIITAYKNAAITKPLVKSLIDQNYAPFHIYLVADACPEIDADLTHPQLSVLKTDPALHLKAKSIIYAVERFIRSHDYVVVFDADNLAHPNFISEINRYANEGYKAVQGRRTAKNLDTMYACADATGEFYKNYVERYVPYLLGGSAVISGSGMAVESGRYRQYLYGPEIQQGKEQWKKMLQEDKILQNDLVLRDDRIAYAWHAIVYDEKVTTAKAVETQRSRWLYSYFQNMPNALRILSRGLRKLSFNQVLFGIITIAPPLFILLLSALLLTLVGLLVAPAGALLLVSGIVLFFANIFWVLHRSAVPPEIWRAVWAIPLFVWRQIRALFKMGNPNKNFKHTEHDRTVSLRDIIDREGD